MRIKYIPEVGDTVVDREGQIGEIDTVWNDDGKDRVRIRWPSGILTGDPAGDWEWNFYSECWEPS